VPVPVAPRESAGLPDGPLPSNPPVAAAPDPFGDVAELLFTTGRDPAAPGRLSICDRSGSELARFRRDVRGTRVLLLDFVLEGPVGSPIYTIHQPAPNRLVLPIDPFHLVDAAGRTVGEIVGGTGGAARPVLRQFGREVLSAQVPMRISRGFTVQSGSVTVGSVRYDRSRPTGPAAIGGSHLTFESPPSPSLPSRSLTVAFVAFLVAVRRG